MSKITSPILLDSTGQETNKILSGIESALKAANTLVDDSIVSDDRVWSSKKVVEAFTVEQVATGINRVSFDSIGATPLQIKTTITEAPIQAELVLSDEQGNTQEVQYTIPLKGTYYWTTGRFIMEDGTETQLANHCLVATQGTNTLSITNVNSIEVTYKTISKQGGGSVNFDVINGGSAREEA